ncbi:probable inactive receptor kinase At1g27190 [Aristolochia californica]|uniref:probable inactive receptor kinase At1g27190 n=1 Tax=Aristolochia californica TaxID=171875 RepID=UPI0035DA8F49
MGMRVSFRLGLGFGFLLVLVGFAAGQDVRGREDDIRCLRGVKSSLQDPQLKLASWIFSNSSVGFICRFVGVMCWNEQENRVVDLRLPGLGLAGSIPASLQYCPSITTLDFSRNNFSGPIPANVCDWLPFLVHIDLSGNRFSGPIPAELYNCKYLNTLNLDDNSLSGSIPYQLSRLTRLNKFSVANNQLSGTVPSFFNSYDPQGFSGNDGLCGGPLGNCRKLQHKNLIIIIAAGVFGAGVSLLLGFALWGWYFPVPKRGAGKRAQSTGWTDVIRAHKLLPVSLFQKPIVKLKLSDLIAATNNFDPANIIISSRTGTSYKAILPDGSALVIKRFQACKLSEKQFRAEMNSLGQLRHPNLVPLLGFCVVQDEKLLVYKHMPNGSLSSFLHSGSLQSSPLDWPSRLRIAIGAAKGLAWLHHGFQLPVLHQNISSNVILLDEDYDARITDFGLARLMVPVDANASSFIHGDFGDFGYVAPEYASTLVASQKGDVYGFGVVLLELVTAQKPLEVTNAEEGFKGNLVDWVNQLSAAGRIKDVVDKSLLGMGHDDQILQFLIVAIGCVVSRPKDRSAMYQVYQSLRSIGGGHDFPEQFDDFPLIFGRNNTEGHR